MTKASIPLDAAERNDMIYDGVAVLGIIVLLFTAIAFLMWFHRAHKNLQSFEATGLTYTPGWAVMAFFIPIINLVRPYQVAKEVWKASGQPESHNENGADWVNTPVSAIVQLWWGVFLTSNIVAAIGAQHFVDDDIVRGFLNATAWVAVAQAFSVIGALLAITMIWKIDDRQSRRHAQMLSQHS